MTPLMHTTWSFGPVGNDSAMPGLLAGGSALDAVVNAATVFENDPSIDSVGVGGLPDADGQVSLDACVMIDPDRCGGVCFVQRFANPTRIARLVMEKTIHVLLCGAGAEAFAQRQGFELRNLLTPQAKEVWERWRRDPANIDRDKYQGWLPPLNVEEMQGVSTSGTGVPPVESSDRKHDARAADIGASNDGRDARPTEHDGRDARPTEHDGRDARSTEHDGRDARSTASHDTVGVLARDGHGRLAGACSTSGMAFKVPGRVGDSPIIGQGLYVDQRVGAACATGTGELISGVGGSFLVIERMRQGASPVEAIRETLVRIADRFTLEPEHQAAFIVISADGQLASGSLRPGFNRTVTDANGSRVLEPDFTLLES